MIHSQIENAFRQLRSKITEANQPHAYKINQLISILPPASGASVRRIVDAMLNTIYRECDGLERALLMANDETWPRKSNDTENTQKSGSPTPTPTPTTPK